MKAAELFVKCLENEGVGVVFGVPGEENVDIMDALLGSRIKFITTRHEQGAAFMADVYGRLTCKAGVCLSTLGPGATNLITGVADADMDRAPVWPSPDKARPRACTRRVIRFSIWFVCSSQSLNTPRKFVNRRSSAKSCARLSKSRRPKNRALFHRLSGKHRRGRN